MYDAENRLSTRTLPNGVVTTYTYDARDRPLSVVHRNASNVVLVSRTYVRAPGGEPTRITKEDGSYVEIAYDAALRITSERYYTAAGVLEEELGYTYDADGNRLTKTRNGVVSTYSYAAGSRLAGVSTEGELEARVTDNGGRETSLVVDGQQLSLTYDSDDHVTRVVDGSATTDFAFDAAGRRVGVTTAAGTKRFLTAPGAGLSSSPQAITDTSGQVIASYVYAGEQPLAKTTSTGTEYYLTDGMGSVIATSGSAGSLESTIEYDAFGNELGSAAVPIGTHGDFRLHGMWKDPSGLYYVRARVYDSASGRFTSRDPAPGLARAPETLLPYGFVNNNPHRWVDPSGRSLMSFSVGFSVAFNLAATSINYGGALIRGKITTRQYAMLLGSALVTGAIGGLGGGATIARAALIGALANGGASALQNGLEQLIRTGEVKNLTSVLYSAIAGGGLGALGGSVARGFAREGELIEHSTGLFVFGNDPVVVREWLAPLISQSDIVFNNVLEGAISTLENVLYSLSDDHTPPPPE